MKKLNDVNEMYDFLENELNISKEALDLAFGIKGYTEETALDILWWKTAFRSFEQYYESVYGEEEEDF